MQREESISAQLRAMKKFCADNGWKIVGKYVDEAYSATTDKRPQFQQMIADSNKREFDIMLVHKLDRFARNRYDSSLYKQKLRKNGVKLCSVLERLDSSPESILLEGLLESINEFYSANLARESMKGMKENAYKCLFNGGCPGLGYDIDESQHYVINEQEAKAVMLIFSMYLCDYSYQQIADALNADGFLTKIGKPFSRNSFIEILRNEKYTGVYIFNRSESKGYDNKRNSHRNKPSEEIIRIEGGIQPVVEKVLFSVIIVGTSYMDVNINAVGINILLCIFDNAYPHILSEKCHIFTADILHFSFRYLITFKSINSISDIPALADNKRICYILSNILRH